MSAAGAGRIKRWEEANRQDAKNATEAGGEVPKRTELIAQRRTTEVASVEYKSIKSDNLVPFFMPSLSAVLTSEEDKKEQALTKREVLEIRDRAACIMMEIDDAETMHEKRGYRDIDPENCWHDWQVLRREMGRKPDLDPGPRYGRIQTSDPAYQQTIEMAQSTLDHLRNWFPETGGPLPFASIKAKAVDGDDEAVMWLKNVALEGDLFSAELFELPDSLPTSEIGDRFTISPSAVLDWMVNDDGVIYGGYSLRYQRDRMTDGEKAHFDQHIGATRYA